VFASIFIFIDVPFWYYVMHFYHLSYTQRTKSKFEVAHPAKVTRTLIKYVLKTH